MLNVHVTASTRITHQVTPQMIKNGKGAIINLASLSAFFPGPKSYYYCSTKALNLKVKKISFVFPVFSTECFILFPE